MTSRPFRLAFDYRCPFARIASEHVITGLDAGAAWDVTWVPFSLAQVHAEEGKPPVWERPESDSGLLAFQVGIAVRDLTPDRFLAVHRALFDLRHVHGKSLRDPDVLGAVLTDHGIDPESVWERVAEGGPLDVIRKAHEGAVLEHDVWGVPTFIFGEQASFVRLMSAPDGDGALAMKTVDRILDLLEGWPDLNEFKHTTRDR